MGSDQDHTRRDLILLVADGNMKATCSGLLSRPEALSIRTVRFSVIPHPERDPGVYLRAPEFLRVLRSRYEHALVLLDHEGSGREDMEPDEMVSDLRERLAADWGEERCAAVVLDPELEVWLWSESPHVDAVLGWAGRSPALRSWLAEEGHLAEGEAKPRYPKDAVEKALRIARKPRSSALYGQLAKKVSLRKCEDAAFLRFCRILQGWFPPEP